jgi:hypothetical protein
MPGPGSLPALILAANYSRCRQVSLGSAVLASGNGGKRVNQMNQVGYFDSFSLS